MVLKLPPLEFIEALTDSPEFREKLHQHENELENTSNAIKTLIKKLNEVMTANKSKTKEWKQNKTILFEINVQVYRKHHVVLRKHWKVLNFSLLEVNRPKKNEILVRNSIDRSITGPIFLHRFCLESSLSYMGEVIHRIEEARDALVRTNRREKVEKTKKKKKKNTFVLVYFIGNLFEKTWWISEDNHWQSQGQVLIETSRH